MSMQENSLSTSPGLVDFPAVRKVGSGGFSEVFAVKPSASVVDKLSRHSTSLLRRSGGLLAMKQINKLVACRTSLTYEATMRERKLLQQLRGSRFCLQFICSFQTPTHLYMVTEYCSGGNLFDYLKHLRSTKMPPMHGPAFVYLAAELISGIEFIHGKGIIHRDLKPENILLTGEGHMVIADFGLAFHGTRDARSAKREAGTNLYRAPETFWIKDPPHCGQVADWWSLGVILLLALTHKNPFHKLGIKTEDCQSRRLQKLKKMRTWTYLYKSCHNCKSLPAVRLLKRLLRVNPQKRLGAAYGAEKVKRHQLFSTLLPTPAHWKKLEKHQLPPPVSPSCLRRDPEQDVPFSPPIPVEKASDAPGSHFDSELFQGFPVPPSSLSDDEEDGELYDYEEVIELSSDDEEVIELSSDDKEVIELSSDDKEDIELSRDEQDRGE